MTRYAVLCGSAPEDYRQKKLMETYDSLVSEVGGTVSAENVIVFPSGIHELLLEQVLNNILDGADDDENDTDGASDVLLYFCTQRAEDVAARISDMPCEVVRLGSTEIRREVVAYYEQIFERTGSRLTVRYETDCELVSEDALGYETV